MRQFVRSVKDFWAGVIFIVFGSIAIIVGRNYGMGTALQMGPAYFPTILSGLLIVIGGISLVRSFFAPGDPIGTLAVRGFILIISAIILFGILLRGAGLAIALPVMVIVSCYASIQFRWKYSILLAAGLTVFCIFVFLKGLGVPIPILGSWFGQ